MRRNHLPKKDEGKVTVDMTKAKTIEPIPTGVNCLVAITKWDKTTAKASGVDKIHIEETVVEPEMFKGRIFFDDINLENEYTLGRLLQTLVATGMDEKDIRTSKFEVPSSEQMLGKTLCVTSKIQVAKPGSGYTDQSKATKLCLSEKYEDNSAEVLEPEDE